MGTIYNLQGIFGNAYTYKNNRRRMVKNILFGLLLLTLEKKQQSKLQQIIDGLHY